MRDALLTGEDRAPVWPAGDAGHREALHSTAAACSIVLREVQGQPVSPPVERTLTPGCVLGVGADARQCTRLYAHLTRRRAVHVERWRPALLDADVNPAVVVAPSEHVTSELLSALHDFSVRGTTPGLISGEPGSSLLQQVLCSALVAGRQAVRPLRVDVMPGSPTAVTGSGPYRRVGGDATPSQVATIAGSNAGVIGIFAHSDGFDASLAGSILCTLAARRPQPASTKLGPRCAETGLCHRLGLPFGAAMETGKLLSPDALRALVVVFASCSVLVHADHPSVHPAWSLASRLAENPSIGAALVPTDTMVVSPQMLAPLLDAIWNGVDVGTALSEFHRSEAARRFANKFVLLGDPRTALAPTRAAAEVMPSPRARPQPRITEQDSAHARMLRHCIDASRSGWKASEREAAEAALRKLETYESMSWTWSSGAKQGVAEREMQDAVLDYVSVRGWAKTVNEWLTVCPARKQVLPAEHCGLCDAALTLFECYPRSETTCARRFAECHKCGALESMPLSRPVRVGRTDGRPQLQGKFPKDRWRGRFVAWSQWRRESVSQDWSALSCGEPAAAFPPIPAGPSGPLRLGVVLMLRSAPVLFVTHARASAAGAARGAW